MGIETIIKLDNRLNLTEKATFTATGVDFFKILPTHGRHCCEAGHDCEHDAQYVAIKKVPASSGGEGHFASVPCCNSTNCTKQAVQMIQNMCNCRPIDEGLKINTLSWFDTALIGVGIFGPFAMSYKTNCLGSSLFRFCGRKATLEASLPELNACFRCCDDPHCKARVIDTIMRVYHKHLGDFRLSPDKGMGEGTVVCRCPSCHILFDMPISMSLQTPEHGTAGHNHRCPGSNNPAIIITSSGNSNFTSTDLGNAIKAFVGAQLKRGQSPSRN